jgi:hypothetical protein
MPTVDEIVALVVDVEARIKDDPASGREALRQMLLDGALVMSASSIAGIGPDPCGREPAALMSATVSRAQRGVWS